MPSSQGRSSLTLDAGGWLGQWRQRLHRHAPADHAAVVLRHSRIYLLPTRRGWAAAMCFAVLVYPRLLAYQLMSLLAGFAGPRQRGGG